MRKLKTTVAVVALAAMALCSACRSDRLQSGGAYAPTNSVTAYAPDLAFYQADAAFDLAKSVVDAAFKFEADNRDMLWRLNPSIKRTLDEIRPQATDAVVRYAIARAAYVSNPTPAGLTTLQTALAKAQQLGNAAQAVLANLPTGGAK